MGFAVVWRDLRVVCCVLVVVCCLLFGACWLMCVTCCLSFVVCCLWFAVLVLVICCLSCAVSGSLMLGRCHVLFVVYGLPLFVAWCLLCVGCFCCCCCVLFGICYV